MLPLARLLVFIPLVLAPAALAHDHWIARGGFRSPVNGEWCCGNHDCVALAPEQVKANGVGYDLLDRNETVPYREAQTSMDGQYWRCHRPDGSRRCFFAPPM